MTTISYCCLTRNPRITSHETFTPTPLQVPPEVPLPIPSSDFHVLTPPLDDLVCFYHYFKCYIGVWNLTTGQTTVYDDDDDSSLDFINLGFGFDEMTKDYKIVKILYAYDRGHFVAYVYSLLYMDYGGPLNIYSRSYRDGTFYWGARDLVVSFDMSTEVFSIISIPLLGGPSSSIQEICKLKEESMLIVVGNWHSQNFAWEYEIWALLELGVTQSWTKLLVIDSGYTPLGLWRNELILQSSGRLCITHLFKLEETKEVQLDEPHDILFCVAWTKGKKTFSSSIVKNVGSVL